MKSPFGRRRHSYKALVALLLVVVSMVAVAAAAGSGGPGHGWGWGHGNWGHGNWGHYSYPSWPTYENWSWDNDTSNIDINVEAGNFLDINVPSYYPTGSPCGGCGGGSWTWPGLLINSNQLLDVDVEVDVSQ